MKKTEYEATRVIAQLLRNHEADLKRYIVCRGAHPKNLEAIYERLRDELAHGLAEQGASAPSLPALAYAVARRTALTSADRVEPDAIAWEPTPSHSSPRYGEVLDRLRSRLDPQSAELLELRHARQLSSDEVAFVADRSTSEVEAALARGSAAAVGLAKELTDDESPLEELVRDAFRPVTQVGLDQRRPAVHAARLDQGTVLGGRFEVRSIVQTSGVASTYVADDSSVPGVSALVHYLHRPASTTAARGGAQQKLRLLDSVVHGSLDRIVASGWHLDRLWYATPSHVGHTLAQLVAKGPLSPVETVEVFAPLARALAVLHDRGVVLRNISPDRLLLVQVGSDGAEETIPLISDFEFWILGEGFDVGEPKVIAPELAKRLSESGSPGAGAPHEDVYSLGLALLYSLEPRMRPSDTVPWPAFLASRATEQVEVPDSRRVAPFASTLAGALAKEPAARPTAAELANALERTGRKLVSRRKRRGLAMPLAVAVAAVMLFLVAYFVRESRSRLIHELNEGVDIQALRQELEAEEARSRALESALEARSVDRDAPTAE